MTQANHTTIVLNLHKWNNFVLNEHVSVFWNFDIIHSREKHRDIFLFGVIFIPLLQTPSVRLYLNCIHLLALLVVS